MARITIAPHFASKKTTAARTGIVWPLGLLIWDTDLSELFVGDGSTAGGVSAGGGGGASPDFVVGVYTSASALSIQGAFTFHASQNGNVTNFALGDLPAGKAATVIITWSRTTVNLTADIDIVAGFMAPGDGFQGREVADTTSTYSFGTTFQIEQDDVSAVFATAVAGDNLSLEITNNSGSGTLRIYGVSVSFA